MRNKKWGSQSESQELQQFVATVTWLESAEGNQMADNDDVLDARDAATYLRINEQTVRRLARDNEIPSFKVGGSWRFKKSSLDAWAGMQEQRSSTALKRILVVDDDPGIREVVRRSLERDGVTVDTAGGGDEIMPLTGDKRPDLVFLDLKLPGMDGPSLLAEIRNGWGNVPVIVITGFPDGELMERALTHGPVTLLSKPSTPSQIRDAVQGVLGQ